MVKTAPLDLQEGRYDLHAKLWFAKPIFRHLYYSCCPFYLYVLAQNIALILCVILASLRHSLQWYRELSHGRAHPDRTYLNDVLSPIPRMDLFVCWTVWKENFTSSLIHAPQKSAGGMNPKIKHSRSSPKISRVWIFYFLHPIIWAPHHSVHNAIIS